MAVTKNEAETQFLAKEIANKIKNGGLVCLYGEIGTGKTTFTKGLAHHLGIEKFSVKSPTYTYIRKYNHKEQSLYHIDLYRLEETDELLSKEIEEIAENKNNIIIIEWAEKLKGNLPKEKINIQFEYVDENSREIKIDY